MSGGGCTMRLANIDCDNPGRALDDIPERPTIKQCVREYISAFFMNAKHFVGHWNTNSPHFPIVQAPSKRSDTLIEREHFMAARNLKEIYTDMRPVWKSLFCDSQSIFQDPKEALAFFLLSRTAISAFYHERVRWIRENAWCWYHTETPLLPEIHFEPKLLANSMGRQIMRLSTRPTIVLELLTVADPEYYPDGIHPADEEAEFLFIDQTSSEVEWRRGLHTERSQLILTQ